MRSLDYGTEGTLTSPFRQSIAVFRAVNVVAQNLARAPLALFRGEESVSAHPIATLLERPNSLQSQSHFVRTVVSHLLIDGNAYIYLDEKNSFDVPRSLMPLPPERVEPVRSQGDMFSLQGYSLKTRGQEQSEQFIPRDRIVHLQYAPSPIDPLIGIGPLDVARVAIESDHLAGVWNKAVLKNSGSPAGLLKWRGEGRFSEEDARLVKDQWQDTYGGAQNAESVAVLGSNFDFQSIGSSARDMQWLEARKWNLADIARAFNVPLLFLNEYESSGLSDAGLKIQSKILYTSNIIPLAVDLQQGLNEKLVLPFDLALRCKFDFSGVEALREDEGQKLEIAKSLKDLGYSLNDVNNRVELGMPEVDHGDDVLVQSNLMPVDTLLAFSDAEEDSLAEGSEPKPKAAIESAPAAEQATAGSSAEDEGTEGIAFNGAQIKGVIDLVVQVGEGALPKDSAKGILKVVYSFTDSEADAILGSATPTGDSSGEADEDAQRDWRPRIKMRALPRKELRERTGLVPAAFVFDAALFTPDTALTWLTDKGYDDMATRGDASESIRFASGLLRVDDFVRDSFRSSVLEQGVVAILGRLSADYVGADGEWRLPEYRKRIWQEQMKPLRKPERETEKVVKKHFNRWRTQALNALEVETKKSGDIVPDDDTEGESRED
tara:strand:+ start:48 stop:2033 length:1986 start_codon:yes stop_codon:yes gene_type:complete